MASELSRLIEDELKNKGYYVDEDNEQEAEADDEEAPHQALMGALRVEARVKEQQAQKHMHNLKRAVCIGGGIAIVCVVWIVLVVKSNGSVNPGPMVPPGADSQPTPGAPGIQPNPAEIAGGAVTPNVTQSPAAPQASPSPAPLPSPPPPSSPVVSPSPSQAAMTASPAPAPAASPAQNSPAPAVTQASPSPAPGPIPSPAPASPSTGGGTSAVASPSPVPANDGAGKSVVENPQPVSTTTEVVSSVEDYDTAMQLNGQLEGGTGRRLLFV